MANIIKFGGASGAAVGLHSGKIYDDGTITADPDYVYTDEFECPTGDLIMDFGTTANNRYIGIRMYDAGTFYEYWNATLRYREIDNTSYYRAGATARLSFPLALIADVFVLDYAGGKMIAGADITRIVNS